MGSYISFLSIMAIMISGVAYTIYRDSAIDESNTIMALVQNCTYKERILYKELDLALVICEGKPYVFPSVK